MAKIVWTGHARQDLLRFRDFLWSQSPEAAIRAVRAIRAGIHTLKIAPEAGKRVDWLPEEYREWTIPFGKSGYVVLYRILGGAVIIQAIRHGREAGYTEF